MTVIFPKIPLGLAKLSSAGQTGTLQSTRSDFISTGKEHRWNINFEVAFSMLTNVEASNACYHLLKGNDWFHILLAKRE